MDRQRIDRLRADLGPISRCFGLPERGGLVCCPFHDDGTPSLSVHWTTDGRERWRCHGCDRGGDRIDLEAELRGVSVQDLLRELLGPEPRERRPVPRPRPRAPKDAPPPRPEPRQAAAVASLWAGALVYSRAPAPTDKAVAYLNRRLSAQVALAALERELVAATPDDASWDGQRLPWPWRLAVPIYAWQDDELALPCDLALRAVEPPAGGAPKVISLRAAAPSVPRGFGRLEAALAAADRGALYVVEGALNWIALAVAHGPRVIGLHGAASTRGLIGVLERRLLERRREGCHGPYELHIWTDDDEAGARARLALARTAHRLGVRALRVAPAEAVSRGTHA